MRYFLVKQRIIFFLVSIFFGTLLFAQTTIPAMTQPVMDTANIINEETKTSVSEKILALYKESGTQIAVLTVPTLSGESIDEFGTRAARTLKLGQKSADNGVLLTVALEEHKVRIDVGYGLEGTLTDTKCGLIIRNFITPRFKQDDYSGGIQNGVDAIIGVIQNDEALNAQLQAYEKKEEGGSWAGVFIPLGIFLTFFALVVTDATGLGPFGYYWWKAVFTGQPFVRRKRTSVSPSPSFTPDDSGNSDNTSDDTGGGGSSDDYSGDGGDFGGGGASDSW